MLQQLKCTILYSILIHLRLIVKQALTTYNKHSQHFFSRRNPLPQGYDRGGQYCHFYSHMPGQRVYWHCLYTSLVWCSWGSNPWTPAALRLLIQGIWTPYFVQIKIYRQSQSYRQTDRQLASWMDEWTDGCLDGWVDGWMNRRTDGRTDG